MNLKKMEEIIFSLLPISTYKICVNKIGVKIKLVLIKVDVEGREEI